jgi:hypothetical protein
MLCLHNFQQDIILVVFIIAMWSVTRLKIPKKDQKSYQKKIVRFICANLRRRKKANARKRNFSK